MVLYVLAAAKSWTLKLLAFDEYCRFDTSAFFLTIEQASLYLAKKESRSIKTAIFTESHMSKAEGSNVREGG